MLRDDPRRKDVVRFEWTLLLLVMYPVNAGQIGAVHRWRLTMAVPNPAVKG